ncbi:MAG: S26 family signal peptidase [Rhizobiaceae bacterium]|nr:S26 family signal peptidase [Rhizobiaceae bacterium]
MRRFSLIVTFIPVVTIGIASVSDLPTKLVYNASASAPIGFYWIDQVSVSRGDTVLILLPERIRELVESRQYLPPNVPLIKRVVGIEGDKICRTGQEILLNNITLTVALVEDDHGRGLPVWSGCITLGLDSFFLLQNHPNSFDGRYFGPIDRALIIGRARKLEIF